MSLSPGGGEFVLAGSPTRTVSGESIGSIAGSADTSPSTSTLPGNLNVGYGGGQGLLVSNSNNGATVVASPMGIPQGPVEIGAGSGPTQIVGSGTASTTASPTVTSSSPITQTEDLNASYGGGQALLVNNANNGATVTGSPTGIAAPHSGRFGRTDGNRERRQWRHDHGFEPHKPIGFRTTTGPQCRLRRRTGSVRE